MKIKEYITKNSNLDLVLKTGTNKHNKTQAVYTQVLNLTPYRQMKCRVISLLNVKNRSYETVTTLLIKSNIMPIV